MADFKNRLISGIFGIFRAVFFTDYSLCKMAEFENRLISGIFGILRAFFFTDCIAFARWPSFKIVSFLEYLFIFRVVFCTEAIFGGFLEF